MKTIIALTTALLLSACAGYTVITEEDRNYEVINDHNLTKEKAYKAVIEWIATNFNSANDVIQLKDQEEGKIILQAVGSYYYDILKTLNNNYRYALAISIKDNKIKYSFTTQNIVGSNNPPQKKDLEDIISSYNKTVSSITAYLNNYGNSKF